MLTVFDWAVEVVEQYLNEVRPAFGRPNHPPMFLTERRTLIAVAHINERFAEIRCEADQRGEILAPWVYRRGGWSALTDEQRLRILRRLLEDRSIDLRDRVAGAVLLLYAQPLTRIARIRTSDIAMSSNGETTLRMARGRFTLPDPLASIALALRYQQLQRTGDEGWLLPGRDPETPVNVENLHRRLRRYDITSCPGRHGALLALAARLPAPILADRLGLNQSRAAQWVQAAGATYGDSVAIRRRS